MTIYLDYNATCKIRPEALAAMGTVLNDAPGNASSVHGPGRNARKHIEQAREKIARAVNVTPKQIIFNSGATEGNNTVLKFFQFNSPPYKGGAGGGHTEKKSALQSPTLTLPLTGGGDSPVFPRILISATEHSSIYETGREMGVEIIPVLPNGTLDLTALEKMCAASPTPALISVMWVNNETGVINPVADIARIAHAHGAAFHIDAVQAFGKIPVDFVASGADFMTISSHKIGGPQGMGALAIGDGSTGACLPPPVLLTGGGQERRLRAGTENVAGIAGFGAAAEMILPLKGGGDSPVTLKESLQQSFQTQIESILMSTRPDTVIFGVDAPRVPNTVCFAVPGTDAQTLLMRLDLAGVYVSSGSACSSGKIRESHVLRAMGVLPELSHGALRISTGWATTQSNIDEFAQIWRNLMA